MTDQITVATEFNSGVIVQTVSRSNGGLDVTDTLFRRVLNLQEAGIRDALIELGWTPPKEEEL